MLSSAPMTTILPVIDMKRARDFYENKLGLKAGKMKPDGKFVYPCAGGAVIALFPKEGGTHADHTAISFQVPDVVSAIRTLEQAGVVFEDVVPVEVVSAATGICQQRHLFKSSMPSSIEE